MAFLWLKALHVVSVVAWMAGLFYLPRLLVYHAVAPVGGPVSEQFKVMERRLLKAIVWPAGIATWIFGGLTAYAGGYFSHVVAWFDLKLVLVAGMIWFHIALSGYVAMFARDLRPRSQRFFRFMNEIPTLLLVAIVVLAVVQPF